VKILTKKIFFLLIIILLTQCSSSPSIPKGIIETETMAQILADIHLTESKLSKVSFQSYDSSKVAFRELERRIFEKYKVDSLTYKKSYDFYANHPEYMVQVYEKVDKILATKKAKKQLN
jgi:hypothetical protein